MSTERVEYRFFLGEIISIIYQEPVYQAEEHNDDWLMINAKDIYFYQDLDPDSSITFVIPVLRSIFKDNMNQLSSSERGIVDFLCQQDIIQFGHPALPTSSDEEEVLDYNNYILTQGEITKYDVVVVPLRDFIDILNKREEIRINLRDTNIDIILTYDEYIFYDKDTGKIIDHVDLE